MLHFHCTVCNAHGSVMSSAPPSSCDNCGAWDSIQEHDLSPHGWSIIDNPANNIDAYEVDFRVRE